MGATQRDVALRAGVSTRTVSNVVNDYEHISADVRRRVLAAIDEVGYRPNRAARSLRTGRSGLIALAFPEFDVGYFAELARLVVHEAERRGYTVLVMQTLGERGREAALLQRIDRQLVDGLLFSASACEPADIENSDTGPVVLLGEHEIPGIDRVSIDNVAAAGAATRHLIDQGCRRIAFVGRARASRSDMAEQRVDGYDRELTAAGLPFRRVVEVDAYHRANGAAAVAELLRGTSSSPVDGLLCANDPVALGAMHALHQAGLRVPDDVAVVGFDDIDDSAYGLVPLTSVSPDKRQIAELAVSRLVDRIRGADDPGRHHQARFELAVRASSSRTGTGPQAVFQGAGESWADSSSASSTQRRRAGEKS
ncbi:LacI family DNA-binding transcriptional regulator [Lentzea sp.]|uniref:LacI family DNA-binding transcriptional regulator n=1 Tax=Lentzea sp. TaxID=56099 RepID=UPI002B66B1C2|nr:LacI family DNA-binding transcriptional regulator [Lentzea sp.]HUQ54663.1 LacI family DNA-binding transcriptional regulator [Lentzea sp.]